MWRRLVIPGVTLLLLLALAGPAWAKGPEGATITGPGIAEPIVIEGSGEYSNGTEFSQFVEATGFWHLVFGADITVSRFGEMTAAPTSDLGPAYIVRWHLLENRIESRVYLESDEGPLVRVEPGLVIDGFNTETSGGWFAAQPILLDLMENYGVPMSATSSPVLVDTEPEPAATVVPPAEPAELRSTSSSARAFPTLPATLILTVLVIGASVWWATRRRPRRVSVP